MINFEKLFFDRPRQDWMTDRDYWLYIEECIARSNMLNRRNRDGEKVLILIKAQHPLQDGEPNLEYAQRLDKALEVAYSANDRGKTVHFITVGGIHQGDPNTTLAEAGQAYLYQYEIGDDIVFAHPEAMNGYEEDAIAAKHFIEDRDYCELHVVCSVAQIDRSYWTFVEMGIVPIFDSITFLDYDPNHSFVYEQRRGIAPFFEPDGNAAVAKASEAIRQRHIAEAQQDAYPEHQHMPADIGMSPDNAEVEDTDDDAADQEEDEEDN